MKEKRSVKRGDVIYLKEPLEKSGHVQGGNRPYLVVSNDTGNFYSDICMIVPITTKLKKENLPTHAKINKEKNIALCEQIFTVSQKDIKSIVGWASRLELLQIDLALLNALGVKK